MNFLKTFFAFIFTYRVLSVLVTILIGFLIFYMVSDLEFMDKVFNGVITWINRNVNAIVAWVLDAVRLIQSKF
jgi:biotin transporter BioY